MDKGTLRHILTLNGGSSSLKFAVYPAGLSTPHLRGQFDRLGRSDAEFSAWVAGRRQGPEPVGLLNHADALAYLLNWLEGTMDGVPLAAIGHRVVHGGARYRSHSRVDAELIGELRRIVDYAPEHLPAEIEMLEFPGHLELLESWLRSYRPEELFDERGQLFSELAALPPRGVRRMSANPHANGGLLLTDLKLPDYLDYAVDVPAPGAVAAEATRYAGQFLRDVLRLNDQARNFRIFGPDETESNRLGAVFEVTDRVFMGDLVPSDTQISPNGRVMEVLSEHLCQGWLEGYLLTGRHGFFSCYEAFIHIVDSMFNQHAKWLNVSRQVPWRKPIASLTYLLTSHVWRQDHNGFSHQDPGLIDHVMNKKADVVRVYLPPDANTLLSVVDHCLRSRDYINVIVAGKQPALQWLDRAAAAEHCAAGVGIWDWASNCGDAAPDAVIAAAGDVPTMEALAATMLLREHFPDLKLRFVNVVDLMTLQAPSQHPHGIEDAAFDTMFSTEAPVVFAYHGYPALIHRLTYRRTNHDSFHVHGFQEEGTTTTPFDMAVLNKIDRFHLARAVVDRVPRLGPRRAEFPLGQKQGWRHMTASSARTVRTCLKSATGRGGRRNLKTDRKLRHRSRG